MTTVSTRRAFLKSAPAAIVSSAVLPASAYAVSASSAPDMPVVASPALAEAHGWLRAALAEQRDANDALEWIADEWRHLWPLAPEELLGGSNGHIGYGRDSGERDLLGRFIHRDTSDLTKRFNAKQRRETPRACFSIDTAEECQRRLGELEKGKPSGRTARALAANTAWREETIRSLRRKVALARQYEAETERLRLAAGVAKARQRIEDAQRKVASAHRDISTIPATTLKDLIIKGESIMNDDLVKAVSGQGGILGQMARFIQDAVDLSGGASS